VSFAFEHTVIDRGTLTDSILDMRLIVILLFCQFLRCHSHIV